MEPDIGNLSRATQTFWTVLRSNGGHPQIGKELKAELSKAGFVNIEPTAVVESYDGPSSPGAPTLFDTFKDFVTGTLVSVPAIKLGIATQEEFDQWGKELLVWQESPGAFAGVVQAQVVGRKP